MDKETKWLCRKCQRALVLRRADFRYLSHTFHTDVLRCPVCGSVFIQPELAEGKMGEVERQLEEK